MTKKFWVSWWCPAELYGKFELHSPWWVTGYRSNDDRSICAAIQAETETKAARIVVGSYDEPPGELEWRFVEEKPEEWSPFNGRFQKAKWMRWEQ